MTARFHYVFIMIVQCILNTKFGLLHRSKDYGSYLWVPDALWPIDYSVYLIKQSPIFFIWKSRGVPAGPNAGPRERSRGSPGTPHFCCKNKEGGT